MNYLFLWGFIILMVGTPGPANLIAMIGGIKYGLRPCAYFIFGLVNSQIILNILIGIGFSTLLNKWHFIGDVLQVVSAIFMIWISLKAWKDTGSDTEKNTQFTFANGLVFHLINPKAWAMCTIAWTQYASHFGSFEKQLLVIGASFAFFQAILHTSWCFLGSYLGARLHKTLILRRVSIVITIGVIVGLFFSYRGVGTG